MRNYNKLIWVSFLLLTSIISAQKTAIYSNNLVDYNQALVLFKNKQFQSAQLLFEKIKNTTTDNDLLSDCAYYVSNCALQLDQANAVFLIENFIKDFPTSPKLNQAYIDIALIKFNQGNYDQALVWLDKADELNWSKEELEKYNFHKGYCFFATKNFKNATVFFSKVINSSVYGNQAKYYLGFMAYEVDDFKEANNQFNQVVNDDKYKEKLSYFQADMSFKSGEFRKAIELGTVAMPKSSLIEKSELNKIIGESYFNLNQFEKALPFLKEYKGKNGKWTNTDFYQLGYTFYKQNDFENAISQFNSIINGKDEVAQNGYYHLAECYLKTDKKQQALNAFKNASEMNFDVKIQEDAFLNYAKLSYEIGNPYQSIPDVLNNFIEKYPKNSNNDELETLLINSYITSKNYKGALVLLEKNNLPENKPAFQKVTFYRGLQLFTDGNYQEALTMFKKSISEPRSSLFVTRATFWKGETEYVLDNFSEALLSFKQFQNSTESKKTLEYKNSNYNIGYCYFKQKEYELAIPYFQTEIETVKDDKIRLSDSYLRLGDCRFVTLKYWPAMEAYNKAIELKSIDADYAAFQKAISYGFVNRNDKKIEDFNKFLKDFPKSKYKDDVLFELANTLVTEKKSELALKTYDQLLLETPNGTYNAKAILKQGLIYYNSDNDDLAILKFKKVAADYPNTPEAIEAVASARLIYVDNGKVDEYGTWVKTLNFIEVSDSELDNDTFKSAEKFYLQSNTKASISGFTNYLAKFPNGIHALKVSFYLAQLYFSEELENNAIPLYEMVLSKPRSEYTEQSLVRLAQIHLKVGAFKNAIPVLKRLETEADFPQNVLYAQANLMKASFEEKDYTNAVIYAEKVLSNPKSETNVKSDAQIMIARAAISNNDEPKARVAYAKLLLIAKGELEAEALYYDAYFKNKDGKFEASNKVIQIISKDFSGYKYYGAKSLLVMAKNFFSLKDSFQATYILNAIIENFKEFSNVVEEAQSELATIKEQEAKKNASIIK